MDDDDVDQHDGEDDEAKLGGGEGEGLLSCWYKEDFGLDGLGKVDLRSGGSWTMTMWTSYEWGYNDDDDDDVNDDYDHGARFCWWPWK